MRFQCLLPRNLHGNNKTICFQCPLGTVPFIRLPNLRLFPSLSRPIGLISSASGEPHPHNGMHRELYGELTNHPIIQYETCLIFGFTI